ncbi:MAG TPA: ribulose-phosphate 3-epimerase [Abditibacteriaceae bacterium]|nr:ribulose-phosphate 3-epimerase [Abditibacteriaceae bacterium]
MPNIKLAPSLIAADWSRIAHDIAELAEAGCEWLHFDAMDGHFVPNLTLGPMFLDALRPHSTLHFDAHLMLANAGDSIDGFVRAGADSITVHVEANTHLHRLVGRIKDSGRRAGVALNPGTPVAALEAILPDLDIALVMSVNPGFSGQKFLPLALAKMEELARRRAEMGLNFLIEVDGGMSPQTAPLAVQAGADVLVCGASSIFLKDQPLAASVRAMRESVA